MVNVWLLCTVLPTAVLLYAWIESRFVVDVRFVLVSGAALGTCAAPLITMTRIRRQTMRTLVQLRATEPVEPNSTQLRTSPKRSRSRTAFPRQVSL